MDSDVRHDVGFGKKLLYHGLVFQHFQGYLHSEVVTQQNV